MVEYVADFETTTLYFKANKELERFELDSFKNGVPSVWIAGLLEVKKDVSKNDFKYFENLKDFMSYIFSLNKPTINFHNLRYDFSYILPWLGYNGYKGSQSKSIDGMEEKTFKVLLTDTDILYQVIIKHSKYNYVYLEDSYKKLMSSVAELGEGINYPKGETPLIKFDEVHKISDEDINYVFGDCFIVASYLQILKEWGFNRLTAGSNALKDYKDSVTIANFCTYIHCLDKWDEQLRLSYHGGFCYVNPKYLNQKLDNCVCYDISSSYPYNMSELCLPIGKPEFIARKKINESTYKNSCFVYCGEFSYEIKEGGLPCILGKPNIFNGKVEYKNNGIEEFLVLTDVDYQLFQENYDIYYENFDCVYCENDEVYEGGTFIFMGSYDFNKKYVEKWYYNKVKYEDVKSLRNLSKLFMNSIYGKFASNTIAFNTFLDFDNDGNLIKEDFTSPMEPVNIIIASFITAYARKRLINVIKDNIDNFIYCDTDSVFLTNDTTIKDDRKNINTNLGSWEAKVSKEEINKGEKYFSIKVLGQKCYITQFNNSNKINIIIAGYNKIDLKSFKDYEIEELKKLELPFEINWENFKYGSKFIKGRQSKKTVNGIVILPSVYEIKE